MRSMFAGLLAILTWFGPARPALWGQDVNDQRKPARFALIFNMGYAADQLPKEPEKFEQLVKTIKDAHFNVVLCAYDARRAEICRKHDVQLFVDLLVEQHHVYKNVEACKKLCESLRKDPTIYGYHLWSDNIAATHPGRTRDVKNVQQWDGTHPAYIGSYRLSKMNLVEGMDLFGYYDFHWTRGGHWAHLSRAASLTKDRQIPFLRYDAAKAGVVGKDNANKVGYTLATSIPFGLKGFMYHYDGSVVSAKTWQPDAVFEDLKKVHAKFASVAAELLKLHHPRAVYSTPVTVGPNNQPVTAPGVPQGLTAIPEKSWFQLTGGEVLVGLCRDSAKRDVLVLASHNPYRSQQVTLKCNDGVKTCELFDRSTAAWKALPMTDRQVRFTVEDYAVELVRFERE